MSRENGRRSRIIPAQSRLKIWRTCRSDRDRIEESKTLGFVFRVFRVVSFIFCFMFNSSDV
ncbi:unnamed protein product [Meloidogyne enterolobii]|uniref:Uncharacterized protein n=1 Tax=Meloidogyne enterolobii TaxID=390850 RepID=A0ACB0YMQ2_MELEN